MRLWTFYSTKLPIYYTVYFYSQYFNISTSYPIPYKYRCAFGFIQQTLRNVLLFLQILTGISRLLDNISLFQNPLQQNF